MNAMYDEKDDSFFLVEDQVILCEACEHVLNSRNCTTPEAENLGLCDSCYDEVIEELEDGNGSTE